MATKAQAWVVKDLASLLGLDQDSVVQMILPDLEGYTNESRLKSHLQDFLGPSPQAKAFTSKYLAVRFPRLSSVEAPPASSEPLKPLFSQPGAPTSLGVGRSKPSSSSATPTSRQPPSHSIPDVLEAAFGPGGKVYQKNREADAGSAFLGAGSAAGGRGSGSSTPASAAGAGVSRQGQGLRQAGALHITEARSRSGGPAGGERSSSQKGKQREEKIWDLPKSPAVKKLEKLLQELKEMQAAEGKVRRVEEGKECFCQARLHPLSHYTPQCAACGLILCHLQPPDRACPSCFRPLLTPSSLARLLLRVTDEIDSQLASEQAARDAVKRAEQRKAEEAAAFPYLAGAGGMAGAGAAGSASARAKEEKGHRVLTIGKGKGTGRITLTTTTTTPTPAPAPQASRETGDRYSESVISRPRSPPLERSRTEKELAKTLKWREEEDRPWGDLKGAKKGEGGWSYVELPIVELLEDDRVGRRRGRKGRGAGGADGRVVPGAVAASG